jgi:hypothetical protein
VAPFRLLARDAERLIGGLALAADGCFLDFALHGRHQPQQAALRQEVVGARYHYGHGAVLAYGSGDNEERYVQPRALQNGQGGRSVEMRQVVVGYDHVPSRLF